MLGYLLFCIKAPTSAVLLQIVIDLLDFDFPPLNDDSDKGKDSEIYGCMVDHVDEVSFVVAYFYPCMYISVSFFVPLGPRSRLYVYSLLLSTISFYLRSLHFKYLLFRPFFAASCYASCCDYCCVHIRLKCSLSLFPCIYAFESHMHFDWFKLMIGIILALHPC